MRVSCDSILAAALTEVFCFTLLQPGFMEMCVEVFLRSGQHDLAASAACIALKCMDIVSLFRSKLGRVFSCNMPRVREVILRVRQCCVCLAH